MRLLASILLLLCFCTVIAQNQLQYKVVFSDKSHSLFLLSQPETFLSQRAIERRNKQGINIDSSDLPIPSIYLAELQKVNNLKILSKSKWFNDVVVGINDTSVLKKIRNLFFVQDVLALPGTFTKSGKGSNSKLELVEIKTEANFQGNDYGLSYRQISMLNADYLHRRNYKGQGLIISVIDAGFSNVWQSAHFNYLYDNERIIATYDFVLNDEDVYYHSVHGNRVLSTMAAYSPDTMIGTAPEAEYILLRSEDSGSEYLLEEYYWTEAAEFADSAGSDIVNSSLGYSLFDDSLQDHRYSDMDGKSTRISLSASKAAHKGILVFNSAGNSGTSNWGKITAPGDAFDVITVGAVDSAGTVADFSSRGPSYDGRIKPDAMAMGAKVFIGLDDGRVAQSNGTSFSSPIMAGAAACLWQANPSKNWNEVKEAIIKSGNQYATPDSNVGYGIPDFYIADAILKGDKNIRSEGQFSVLVYPNPFADELYVTFRLKKRQSIDIEITESMGTVVKRLNYTGGGENTTIIYLHDEIKELAPSLYFMKLSGSGFYKQVKIIKE